MIYGDATGYAAYHTARGRTVTGDTTAQNAALLVAADWIDGVYGPMFVGSKTSGFLQEREWPRKSAYVRSTGEYGDYYTFPNDAIPDQVKYAAYEAAYRQMASPGSLQSDYKPPKYKKVTVEGAISVEYNQFNSGIEAQTSFTVIDKLLMLLIDSDDVLSPLSGSASRV